jgi:NAD(P)H-dependent flavin oxidoreductase YrpB (nitropropane dioxygenase family)
MRTRIADMLGVEFPICAFSHCRDVVAAVTNAGGLGVLGAVAHSPQRLETELTWIEEQTGGKPFGVDLLLPPKYVGAEQGGIDSKQAGKLLPQEHREFVDDLLVRYGIPVPADEDRRPPGDLNLAQGLRTAARRRIRPPHPAVRQRLGVAAGGSGHPRP